MGSETVNLHTLPENRAESQKETRKYSNHPFLGAFAVSFQGGYIKSMVIHIVHWGSNIYIYIPFSNCDESW